MEDCRIRSKSHLYLMLLHKLGIQLVNTLRLIANYYLITNEIIFESQEYEIAKM